MAQLSPSGSHYVTVRGDHALRLHPSCVLYAAPSTSRWPKWILFTRVHLSAPVTDNPGAVAGGGDPANATATCISGVSAIQPEWLMELAPHYFHYGTAREHALSK